MSVESRKEILDLLANGKIGVDEAAEMLAKASAPAAAAPEPATAPEAKPEPPLAAAPVKEKPVVENGQNPGWFRIRVSNLETGKSKVSVNIPLRMLKFGFTLASHFTPEVAGLNMDELQTMLADGGSGILVDVQDEESQEHVQIYID
ncbi:MAG: hypothetical protein R3E31_12160 [Chloroflexota bacterium]